LKSNSFSIDATCCTDIATRDIWKLVELTFA
jgi:hypothetical protein